MCFQDAFLDRILGDFMLIFEKTNDCTTPSKSSGCQNGAQSGQAAPKKLLNHNVPLELFLIVHDLWSIWGRCFAISSDPMIDLSLSWGNLFGQIIANYFLSTLPVTISYVMPHDSSTQKSIKYNTYNMIRIYMSALIYPEHKNRTWKLSVFNYLIQWAGT